MYSICVINSMDNVTALMTMSTNSKIITVTYHSQNGSFCHLLCSFHGRDINFSLYEIHCKELY